MWRYAASGVIFAGIYLSIRALTRPDSGLAFDIVPAVAIALVCGVVALLTGFVVEWRGRIKHRARANGRTLPDDVAENHTKLNRPRT